MIGAMLGDIIGSVYEFDNIKTKEFELFRSDCEFTDDTVMTVAVADALMHNQSFYMMTSFLLSLKNFYIIQSPIMIRIPMLKLTAKIGTR